MGFGRTDHHQASIQKLKMLTMLKMLKMLVYLSLNAFFMGSHLHDLLLWPIQIRFSLDVISSRFCFINI